MKKAYIQLHLAVLLAGFTGILGRLIQLNEAWLVWYRVGLTALAFWILLFFRKEKSIISAKTILSIMLVGMIATAHWVTFYASIKYANVSIGLVCFSSIGFFTSLFEPLLLRTPFRWIDLFLGLVTLLGIYLIFHFDWEYRTGILLGLVSSLLASLFPIWNRYFLREVSSTTLLAWQQTGGFIFLTAILPLYLSYSSIGTTTPTLTDWGWILFLVGGCSVWAFQLSAAALKKLSAFTVNLSYGLEPVYGILLAFWIFREDKLLHAGFYLGASIILAALALHAVLLIRTRKKI
ncbi:MAG: DMT family transporter [Bacteroidota bacterium]